MNSFLIQPDRFLSTSIRSSIFYSFCFFFFSYILNAFSLFHFKILSTVMKNKLFLILIIYIYIYYDLNLDVGIGIQSQSDSSGLVLVLHGISLFSRHLGTYVLSPLHLQWDKYELQLARQAVHEFQKRYGNNLDSRHDERYLQRDEIQTTN